MPTRRDLLRDLASVGVLSVAGCVGSGDDGEGSGEESHDQAQSQEQDQQQDQQQGKQSPSARQGDEIPPVEVVIDYWSDWTGHIRTEDSGTSVQGYGKDAWKLSPKPSYVSVNAQKQDDSRDPLTIEIYVDGVLVNEQSTTAEYGVASLSVSP